MKKILLICCLFSSISYANISATGSLIDACGAVPRLYSVASLAALDADENSKWVGATYQVATELMIGNSEADHMIDALRNNKDVALRLSRSGGGQNDPVFMQDCMIEPGKYIPSYDRLVKAGKLQK